jgi:hypothetical protein
MCSGPCYPCNHRRCVFHMVSEHPRNRSKRTAEHTNRAVKSFRNAPWWVSRSVGCRTNANGTSRRIPRCGMNQRLTAAPHPTSGKEITSNRSSKSISNGPRNIPIAPGNHFATCHGGLRGRWVVGPMPWNVSKNSTLRNESTPRPLHRTLRREMRSPPTDLRSPFQMDRGTYHSRREIITQHAMVGFAVVGLSDQ